MVPGKLSLQITKGQWKSSLEYKPSQKLHFSCSDTTDCNRKRIYTRMGTPYSNPFTITTQDRMSKGTGLQDYIRGVLIPNYSEYKVLFYQPEQRLEMEYDVEMPDTGEIIRIMLLGYSDGVLAPKTCPEIYDTGLEVKTTSGIKGIVDSRLGTKEDHWSSSYLKQGNRYLNLWNDMIDAGVLPNACKLKRMLFFIYGVQGYAMKDTGGPFMDFTFDIDREAFKRDLLSLAEVERDLRDGKEGERRVEEPDFWCKGNPEGTGCQYYYKCWGLKKRAPRKPPTLGGVTRTSKPKAVRKKAKK